MNCLERGWRRANGHGAENGTRGFVHTLSVTRPERRQASRLHRGANHRQVFSENRTSVTDVALNAE